MPTVSRSVPRPLRLVSYRPGNPAPPKPARPTVTKRSYALERRVADRQREIVRTAWLQGFCVGILTGFGVLLFVTAMHYAGRGW